MADLSDSLWDPIIEPDAVGSSESSQAVIRIRIVAYMRTRLDATSLLVGMESSATAAG